MHDVMGADKIERAVVGAMEKDSEVRKKVEEMGEMARKAVKDGGSSFASVGRFFSMGRLKVFGYHILINDTMHIKDIWKPYEKHGSKSFQNFYKLTSFLADQELAIKSTIASLHQIKPTHLPKEETK
ncbi:hypothetical protein ACFX10_029159 [Malus domestica]